MESIRIRRGVEPDAGALAAFAARTFADVFGADNRAEDLRDHLASAYGIAQQTQELNDPSVATLLVYRGRSLVAYAQVRIKSPPPCVTHERTIELHRFYVDRSAHGTGVAQQLMAAVRAAAREFGGQQLWLSVWERNPRALSFYKKEAFVDVGSTDFYVGSDRQTDRVLLASLQTARGATSLLGDAVVYAHSGGARTNERSEGSNMIDDQFRRLIERGDPKGLRSALDSDSGLANRTIHWFLNQENESDPLHYVSDCVGHGWLTNGKDGELAELLIEHGAAINGTEGRESPLIASASLGAGSVSKVLIEAGAELEATSIFGSRALHWAAWVGMPSTVELLIAHGAEIEARCSEFGATPLFWAVHGYGPNGPKEKMDQIGAARMLIKAGARMQTTNKHGVSALELSSRCQPADMYELLRQSEQFASSKYP
ncbi:MAG TPA: GNAT family N-acetyltransferase [Steroidobacteraceae bacterium]